MHLRIPLLAAAFLAAAMLGTSAAFDQIIMPRRAPIDGEIVAMSPTEITLKINAVERKFPVNEIAQINFDGEPTELRTARRMIDNGQFDMALERLAAIDLDTVRRDVIRQDIQFWRAYAAGRLALGGSGDRQAAVRLMVEFRTQNPGSYHFFRATEMLGDLAVAMGRYDAAAPSYAQLAQAPWPDLRLRAMALEGRALQAQGKHAEALEKFNTVIGANVTGPQADEEKKHAQLGRAVSLAATGKHAEAQQIVQEIIKNNDPQDVRLFARAYNALGACHRAAGKPKDALIAYLHTDILFYGDPEAHAEALFYLSELWPQVGKAERALGTKQLLRQRYGNSVWAGKI